MEYSSEAETLLRFQPWELFAEWWSEVQSHPQVREKSAMSLATASSSSEPLIRTVLLKEFSKERGFIFYTNYESRKGDHLLTNPQVSLLFYWDCLFRQVIVRGSAEKVDRMTSEKYWSSRPRESQISGWLSLQSRPIPPNFSLIERWKELESAWAGRPISCPPNWGGYAVKPQEFEFWVGHKHRLHDRVRFSSRSGLWTGELIFP